LYQEKYGNPVSHMLNFRHFGIQTDVIKFTYT
jgi:hypothetical protein